MSTGASDAFPKGMGARTWWPLPLIALVMVAAFGGVGLSSLWPELHVAWSNVYGAFSHGYLVLALGVWLAIRYWKISPPTILKPWWPAIIALALLVGALCLMQLMFVNTPRLVLLPLIFLAVIASLFGLNTARVLMLPSLFIYCALPQWWVINGALQQLTASVANLLITATRQPAYMEGNFVHVPAGVFEIASGCSGLNYLIAALSLSGFQALAYLKTWKSRSLLVAAAMIAALVSNWIRVYVLIVVGITTDMQHYLIQVDHLYFGWILFLVCMVPVFVLARRLDDATDRQTAIHENHMTQPVVSSSILGAAAVAGLILLLPRVGIGSRPEAASDHSEASLPMAFGDWRREEMAEEWRPQFINAQEEQADYSRGGGRVAVFRAHFPWQTVDARLIRPENTITGEGWQMIDAGERNVLEDGNGAVTVLEYHGRLGGRESVLWTWYSVAGAVTTSKFEAKLMELGGLASGRRDAAAIGLFAECVPDCAAARDALSAVMVAGAATLR